MDVLVMIKWLLFYEKVINCEINFFIGEIFVVNCLFGSKLFYELCFMFI